MSNLSLRIDTVSVNVVAVAGMAKSEYLSQKCSNYMDKVNSLTKTIRDLNTRRSALISSLSTLKASMETELAILKSKMISATNTIESANYNINMMQNKMSGLAPDDQASLLSLAGSTMKLTAQRNLLMEGERATEAAFHDLTAEHMRVEAMLRTQVIASQAEQEMIATMGSVVSQLWKFKDLTYQRTEVFRIMTKYSTAFAKADESTQIARFGLSESLSRLNRNLEYDILNSPDGYDGTAVFDYDVDGTDVYQGGIGDCWLIAVLSGVAARDRDAIKDIITVTGHNEYKVKLYDAKGKRFTVNVNADEYTKLEETNGGDSASRAYEEWVAILEVAIAKSPQVMKTGSTSHKPFGINGGSNKSSESVYSAITGGTTSSKKITRGSSKTFTMLNDGLKDNGVVVIDTDNVPIGAPESIVSNHKYTVVNTYVAEGKEYVTLRNPWGAGVGTEQGYVTLDIDTIEKYFKNAQIGKR